MADRKKFRARKRYQAARRDDATGPRLEDFAGTICPQCLKPESLCVCADVEPIANAVSLLILQHPQEQDKVLDTARLALAHFRDATFKIGLSWPSLAALLGRPVDSGKWAVLYLGSTRTTALPPNRELVAVDAKGQALADQEGALSGIQGIVLFDGTWSQAKTLWWRNPWVLKTRRLVLAPRSASRYGRLRREPRREGLSTLEAAALAIARLEQRPEIETALGASFDRMLVKYRAARRASAGTHPNRSGAQQDVESEG